jgi:HpiC1 cyclase
MKKIRHAWIGCIIGVLSMVLFAQGIAWGTPLTILNPSFEAPTLSAGGYNFVISDWVQSGVSGVWYPAAGYFNVLPPDGNQVAYENDAGTVISQQLAATLLPNATYTLKVDLGSRLDAYPFPAGTSVALYAGSNLLASDNTIVPQAGNWTTDTVIFTSSADTIGLGENLKIVLTSNGTQADFDNVRLDVTSVPVPPSALLLGSGLLGLVGLRKFRKC